MATVFRAGSIFTIDAVVSRLVGAGSGRTRCNRRECFFARVLGGDRVGETFSVVGLSGGRQ